MKNPFNKLYPELDFNVTVQSFNPSINRVVLESKNKQFRSIEADYLPKDFMLEVGDEFEFGSLSDISGGHFFQLKLIRTDQIVSFSNYIINR